MVPNLMIGFGIDETQAEYVAEIKLRHLNREYILKRIQDIENLENEIAQLEEVLSSQNKMKKVIVGELQAVARSTTPAAVRKFFTMCRRLRRRRSRRRRTTR